MIPIRYDFANAQCKNHLIEYDNYLDGFKHRLELAIKRGYLGQLQQEKDKKGDVTKDNTLYLNGTDLELMKKIQLCLKVIAYASPNKLPKMIDYFTKNGVTLGSNIHKLLHHAFVENGYEATGSTAFPKDIIVKALDVEICPYCNREGVKAVPVEKADGSGTIVTQYIKAELDHFYPKELYPYLALSLYNLIPSCGTCNHYPNKYKSNPYETSLTSPYLLKDANGMRFLMKIPITKATELRLDDIDVTIEVQTKPFMSRNEYDFSISALYNAYHKPEVAQVYNIYKSAENQSKIIMTNNLVSYLGTPIDVMENAKINAEANYAEKDYTHILVSKLRCDIWSQLEAGKLIVY